MFEDSSIHGFASCLDIGCEIGHFLYFLEKEGYANYWGVTPPVASSIDEREYCDESRCRQFTAKKTPLLNSRAAAGFRITEVRSSLIEIANQLDCVIGGAPF
jgi:hypothetical protein